MCPEGYRLLLTCEHGGNRVPPSLSRHFVAAGGALRSHRGWDPGALELAEELARATGAPLLAATTSRLVVDLNRAPGSRSLFSEFTRTLADPEREVLLRECHTPHREAATAAVAGIVAEGRAAVHVSVHTFTPVLGGLERQADVGLLYDPSRAPERALCARWREALVGADASLRVRRNYPYRGTADGLTTCLRRQFPPAAYLGIELEVNQRYPLAGGPGWPGLQRRLCETLADALAPGPGTPGGHP